MRKLKHKTGLIISDNGDVFNDKTRMKQYTVNGYKVIDLNGKKHRVHRLVAECFVPNPYGLPQVNHKDCNKSNNHFANLEWVTQSDNMKHSYDNGFKNNPVQVMRNDGKIYESMREAARDIGINVKCVWAVVNGFQKTAGGYSFKRTGMS